jgi:hypothetical protein
MHFNPKLPHPAYACGVFYYLLTKTIKFRALSFTLLVLAINQDFEVESEKS